MICQNVIEYTINNFFPIFFVNVFLVHLTSQEHSPDIYKYSCEKGVWLSNHLGNFELPDLVNRLQITCVLCENDVQFTFDDF